MMQDRPASLLDVVTRTRWFQSNSVRRLTFLVLAVVLAFLSLFPRLYAADVKLAPQESNTAGLSAILSQLGGNYAALLGRSQPVEVSLAIARSYEVKRDVVRKLGNKAPEGSADLRRAILELEDQTDVQAMRGNLIEIVIKDRDADRALNIARQYVAVMRARLAELSRQSTSNKRKILDERFTEARIRLSNAERAVSAFRRANQLVMPEEQLNIAVQQLAGLQGQLKAKQVQLQTALQFNTPQSFAVRALQAEYQALQAQVRTAEQQARGSGGMTAAGIAPAALQFENLNRELKFSQALYDSYTRYLEGAAIEDLTAEYNFQEVEPPYVDPETQFNVIPLALLIMVALFALMSEFLIIRPAPGLLRVRREQRADG